MFRTTTWGEPHGKGIGVVIDGCPVGLELSETDIQVYLDKRRPEQSWYTAMRQESDQVEVLSSVFEGRMTGVPISLLMRNQDQRSHDYNEVMGICQPGHADYTFDEEHGFRGYRDGGRSSGREIIGGVTAGVVAVKPLDSLGVQVTAYTRPIGGIEVAAGRFGVTETGRNRVCMPDAKATALTEAYLDELMEQKDSAGGVVECVVDGVPAGIGETVFDRLDARLAQAVVSIGAAGGVEIGDGFAVAKSSGFGNNGRFYASTGEGVEKRSNHSRGILGGMSDGSRIVLRVAFRPTPSIASKQHTVNRDNENVDVVIKGCHDPIMVPRAVMVVGCMTALTILDMMLYGMTSRLSRIARFYDRRWTVGRIMGETKRQAGNGHLELNMKEKAYENCNWE